LPSNHYAHPMFASALLRETRPTKYAHYIKSEKNIPSITDRNLKHDNQILIIFGRNISDTTGY